ncbi:serine/threonine protein kinase UL97 [Striga asiatica]|uniref:Serine/threonine protein kinase UL97 n=1 Tax=Striga asiatica TaxID=4170 RepID=A0A5A7RDU4_STRAF|nr:serine/threonine protein kinase UL97 [Striga asiatica]
MAPGVRNPKARIIPNNSRQSLMEHMTNTGALAKSKTRQSEKTDSASDKVNKGLPITDGSSIRSAKCESDVRGKHGNYLASASSILAKEEYSYARNSDSSNSKNDLQNQSQQHGSNPDPPSHQRNQHRQSPQADIIGTLHVAKQNHRHQQALAGDPPQRPSIAGATRGVPRRRPLPSDESRPAFYATSNEPSSNSGEPFSSASYRHDHFR